MGVSIKNYWKRNGYTKLDRLDQEYKNNRKIQVAKFGDEKPGTGGNRRRFWRFNVKRKLKVFKMGSVKKFFVKLRDGYVNMMLGLANSRILGGGGGGYGYGGGCGGSSGGFGIRPMKEYDEKMIVEIYKSILLAQTKIVQGDAEKPGLDLVVTNHQSQNLVK